MATSEKTDATADYVSDVQSTTGSDLPPPAYRKPYSNSVKIARILSATFVLMTLIVGGVVLLSIYIQTSRECECKASEAEVNGPLSAALSAKDDSGQPEASRRIEKKIPVPLHLKFDTKTGRMMKKEKKAKVDCVIERKKATHIISHQPKLLITPFGNLTTNPRLIHVTGEKIMLSCFSGNKNPKYSGKKGSIVEASRIMKRSTGECLCDCAC